MHAEVHACSHHHRLPACAPTVHAQPTAGELLEEAEMALVSDEPEAAAASLKRALEMEPEASCTCCCSACN